MLEQLLREHYGRVAHIAHHVQDTYFSPPSQPFHNPSRVDTVGKIVEFTQYCHEMGIPTFATAIIEEWDDDGRIHPDVKKHAADVALMGRSRSEALPSGQGIEASAYRYPLKLSEYSLHFLTGYNTDQCVLDTVRDKPEGTIMIIPESCTDVYRRDKETLETKKAATIEEMRSMDNVYISSMNKIKTAIDRIKPALVG